MTARKGKGNDRRQHSIGGSADLNAARIARYQHHEPERSAPDRLVDDTRYLLALIDAPDRQITHSLTVGVAFVGFSRRARRHGGVKLGYLTTCQPCAGTWVGFGIVTVTPQVVPLVVEPVANCFMVSFAVALVGRVWNEGLALTSSKVSEIRLRAAPPN